MATTTDVLNDVHALAQTEEPTAEMIAASAAEGSQPMFVSAGISAELSGGAGAMYLREIGNHELLNQQAEVQLAQRMEVARTTRALLVSGAVFDDLERERLKSLVDDGERARRHLIECNLRLVVSV